VDGDKPLRELQKQSSAVRDAVLSVLRAKTLTEVQGADGMARLAGDLSGAIGKFLTKGKVLKVNFLEFMTQ
ncbi:MAG: flagellar basal body-associated FliL family protein, partial [Bacillota bacterium]